tara:strand:+ start:174 stop:932 length:759 start_codon:yes stop_codon:yes gene_type:complete
MDPIKKFNIQKKNRIKSYNKSNLSNKANNFFKESIKSKYSYNFTYLGLPIIQYPQDIVKFQEIFWDVKPDLIIETGIAHGGSLNMSSSMLALLNYSDLVSNAKPIKRKLIGIDIDIRAHNLKRIKKSPYYHLMHLINKSSIAKDTIKEVKKISKKFKKIMVLLDSNHTHDHVLSELNAYAPLVSKNSYCIVYDTFIQELNNTYFKNRPWNITNNPGTAVKKFLLKNKNFLLDKSINNQLLISSAKNGYLKRK